MLVVDPAKRISTTEILSHPWLRDESSSMSSNTSINTSSQNQQPTKLLSKKGTNANLSHALKHLTGHVTQRRTEKLASGFTKLVSNMQESSSGRASLLKKYARPLKQSSTTPMPQIIEGQVTVSASDHLGELNEEETMAMMNPDIK
jgi:serine/threonine protein kinase